MQVVKNKSKKVLAKDLKILIANYINSQIGNINIASEVMYGSSRNVVDMLFVYRGNLYGIEIKSEGDNTSRLPGQLKEYDKLFDYILVFSSESHLNSIEKLITDHVGLFYFRDTRILKYRKPVKNKKTDKLEMLMTIPSSVIKSHFKITGHLNSDEIRRLAFKKSKKDIHQLLISYFDDLLRHRPNVSNHMSV